MRGLIGLGGTLAWALSTAAAAQAPVTIDRAVYVERAINGSRSIEPATTLQRGDKVVLILTWQTHSATRGFTVSSKSHPLCCSSEQEAIRLRFQLMADAVGVRSIICV